MLVFGTKVPGKEYIHRLCAYAVLLNEEGQVGIVETPIGGFLVGGGIEAGEDPLSALAREALEEIGMSLDVIEKIGHAIDHGSAELYRHSEHYWSKEGHFFRARTLEFIQDPIEADHQFKWMSKEEATEKLLREAHRWAVEQCF